MDEACWGLGGISDVPGDPLPVGGLVKGFSQNQRRVWMWSRTVKPCQGRSFRWRMYQLWTRPEG